MKTISEDIKTKNFRPVYLLYGEETYLRNLYRKRLTDAIVPEGDEMNFTRFTGKDPDIPQIIEQAETMPFFAEHRLILIEESGFFERAVPELAAYLPKMPKETILLFSENEVDRRGKLYKTVESIGHAAVMNRQDEKTLTSWILGRIRQDKKQIHQDAFALFREMTGNDMETIDRELEKLLSYTLNSSEITRSDVEAVCSRTPESRIFDMIRAVAGKRQREALDLYYELLSLKEPPMRILYLTARQFNQMLQAKDLHDEGRSNAEIAAVMKLSVYAVKNILAQTSHFSEEALLEAVTDCVEAEGAVKNGDLNDRMAVELLLIKFTETSSASGEV